MIEMVLNDRLGKKVCVKCNDDDTIGDLKKLVAAQTGTRADKIRIQKRLPHPNYDKDNEGKQTPMKGANALQ
ncbi:hypothetical protein E1A91_A10G227000v1 [Gossypium mustelinum]|uniref:Ubiquitin-like domain-containing protein n=1 Tax=Gossypium mustelinum TaxID=34275 RepID=A0A5D2XT13_GOSMU|nr:hypothetical protein E1A91_A10G227000v1 [Gossypium mustelinum]